MVVLEGGKVGKEPLTKVKEGDSIGRKVIKGRTPVKVKIKRLETYVGREEFGQFTIPVIS